MKVDSCNFRSIGTFIMWTEISYNDENDCPCNRSKHSITLLKNDLYLLAGRNRSVALKDFWRYDIVKKKWYLLKPSGDCPPCLQEHTAVSYLTNIYVFGGELGFSSGLETPLWIYETDNNIWRKIKSQIGVNVPIGRRGHTCLVHRDSTLIYGGYCDLKGSSNELWIFHFETESWHLLDNSKSCPPARHKHSAVMHGNDMWMYGGMTDLEERSDLWRFDTISKKWYMIKCKVSPGSLHSHVAVSLRNSMIIFGGEKNGQHMNELWRFHFGIQSWQIIQTDVICPPPLSESQAVLITSPAVLELIHKNGDISLINLQLKCSDDSHPHSGVEPYSSSSDEILDFPFKDKLYRRPATAAGNSNLRFLKEISKLSQINISRLGLADRHSYQMLGSNESLDTTEETVIDDLNLNDTSKVIQTKVMSDVTYQNASVIEGSSKISENLYSKLGLSNHNHILVPSSDFSRNADCTSPEITSDYASSENIHELMSSNSRFNGKSFSNPNYLMMNKLYQQSIQDEDESNVGNYIKLMNSSYNVHEEKLDYSIEMTDLKPTPSNTLYSNYSGEIDESKKENIIKARNAGHCRSQQSTQFCVLFFGGKTNVLASSLRKPISTWRLSIHDF